MVISIENNRKYNGMLNDIRSSVSPVDDSKSFRVTIKQLDPNFPRNNDGSKKSMKDITEQELVEHTSFIKTMCLRQGVRLEYFSDIDVMAADEAVFKAQIMNIYEKTDKFVVADVVCSNCGCVTKRGLSQKRYKELKEISAGKREEIMEPLADSFLCANCLNIKIKQQEAKQMQSV